MPTTSNYPFRLVRAPFHEVLRPSAMNGRSGTFSPASTDGSEWSGISRYNTEHSPLLSNNRANLATPPVSGSSNGIHGPMINGTNRRPGDPGNPSPPNSVARSSNGTNISEWQRRKTLMMEESLGKHYAILKRYLAQSLRDEKGNPKPNKARDKLLRLSPVQFQELSTDVYDELLRRQSAGGSQANGPGQVPMFLLPKENFHPKRNQARQKLATLPPPRFRDLATDVFYELERRFPRFAGGDIDRNGSPALSSIGPPSRQGTPNGLIPGPPAGGFASRKASLGAGLAIPGVGAQEPDFGKPTPKTFQSNTIIPNKGTLVEDDDDQTESEYRGSEAFGSRRDTRNTFQSAGGFDNSQQNTVQTDSRTHDLQEKDIKLESIARERDLALLERDSALRERDSAIHERDSALLDKESALIRIQKTEQDKEKVSTSEPCPCLALMRILQVNLEERELWAELRLNLESKLRDALNLINNLQSELEKVRTNHAETKRELEAQKELTAEHDDAEIMEWRTRFENLDRAHKSLQADLRAQQTVTNEVKQEAAIFLDEMRTLSSRSNQSCEREENLLGQVHKLEDQLKQWKGRYAGTKSQLQILRASSLGLSLQQPDMTQLGGFMEQNGLVNGVHVTRFQIAIDELLWTAREGEPDSVLAQVKSVVIAVRNISQDLGEVSLNDDKQGQQMIKRKSRISATANNLITAAKNFAISKGLSPASLLDAAASHLTSAVVNLIHIVKIHPPLPLNEHEDDDDESFIAESPAYYGINFEQSNSGRGSIYSAFNSPQPLPLKVNSQAKQTYRNRDLSSRDGPLDGLQHRSTPSNVGLGLGVQDDGVDELKVPCLSISSSTSHQLTNTNPDLPSRPKRSPSPKHPIPSLQRSRQRQSRGSERIHKQHCSHNRQNNRRNTARDQRPIIIHQRLSTRATRTHHHFSRHEQDEVGERECGRRVRYRLGGVEGVCEHSSSTCLPCREADGGVGVEVAGRGCH